MSDTVGIVLDKLVDLIRSDPELTGHREVLLDQRIIVGDGKCLLTLQALFAWVQEELPVDYGEFRSQLYSSDLNQQLRTLGYTLEVASASGHVDTSIYQLVKL